MPSVSSPDCISHREGFSIAETEAQVKALQEKLARLKVRPRCVLSSCHCVDPDPLYTIIWA